MNSFESQIYRALQHSLDVKRQILDDYSHRIVSAGRERLNHYRHSLSLLAAQLEGLDSQRILQRGFTLTLKEGEILKNGADLTQGELLETIFSDARVQSRVEDTLTIED